MRSFLPTILLIACFACSGGGGSSEGGIGGSGISQGAVTATGSATVVGTNWDIDSADATFDRVPGLPSDVQVGMVVTVEGSRSQQTGVADRIDFDDSIEGPISAISPDPPALTDEILELTILGQTVIVERGFTVFDGTSFDTVDVDDVVEVSGYPDGNGVITATRVEFQGVLGGGMPPVELRGTVKNLVLGPQPEDGKFEIGSVDVVFDPTGVATDLSDMPGGEVFEDDFVEVEGIYDPGMNEITAARIEPEGEGIGGDVEDFEVEGIVSGFSDLNSSFLVGSQTVLATMLGIEFEPPNPSFVANGVRVEVEGSLVDGLLIADSIKQRDGEARVSAAIADPGDIDLVAGTVTLLGDITIFVDGATRLEDDRDDVEPFGLSDLAVGDFLEVRGVQIPGGVRATELERDDPEDAAEVRGRLETFVGPPALTRTFTLLGHEIETGPSTSYEGFPPEVVDEQSFYNYLGNNLDSVLEAKGDDPTATTLDFADEVELEDD